MSGIFSTVVSGVKRVARGTLGAEFFTGGKRIAEGARAAVNIKTCPRCFESSLIKISSNRYQCERNDICGWSGSDAELKALVENPPNISPLVYAVAKGKAVDAAGAYKSSKYLSWLLWLCVAAMLLYCFYMIFDGRLFFALWIGLVDFLFAMHAVRFSYRAQHLLGRFRGSPKAFLLRPSLWFVR